MAPVKVLNVAEKPSVAKEISAILSGGNRAPRRRQGGSDYNPIWEFGCQIRGELVDMVFTSVRGHLLEMEFVEPYCKNWHACRPGDLFTIPVEKKVAKDKEGLERCLKSEARVCQRLILWLDCDLEGENIAFEVMDVCRAANSRLRVERARFSALIPREIWHALEHLVEPNVYQSEAVNARMEIDLRIGAAFTRFQTLKLQGKFDGVEDSIISYGPCQFPTMGFVVDRYKAIESFQREEFWRIQMAYRGGREDGDGGPQGITRFQWKRERLFDEAACAVLYVMVVEAKEARVTHVNAAPATRDRPLPLSTVELQKKASRFFNMSSDVCMHVAEELYTKGFISYPRTETESFSRDADLRSLIAEQGRHPAWGAFARELVGGREEEGGQHGRDSGAGKFRFPRKGSKDDQAHPPIHPTKLATSQELKGTDEQKVYELVVRHFLACCSDDAKGKRTKVTVEMGGEEFTATGIVILERNWLDVYNGWEKWHASTLPANVLQVGAAFVPTSLTLETGRTQPPPLLSEADLISRMDEKGIGTDATIAQHIKTILQRKYVTTTDQGGGGDDGGGGLQRRFQPTNLGLGLVEGYEEIGYQLTKPELRAEMERECKRVARGERGRTEMVQACLLKMKECFEDCQNQWERLPEAVGKYLRRYGQGVDRAGGGGGGTIRTVEAGFSQCGHCQGRMDLRRDKSVLFLACETCAASHLLPHSRKGTSRPSTLTPPVLCPLCGFEALLVTPEGGGREGGGGDERVPPPYHMCPWCYHHPPASGTAMDNFRCAHCTGVLDRGLEGREKDGGGGVRGPCPLARAVLDADKAVLSCRGCKGQHSMTLRKNERGLMLGCQGFPACKGTIYFWGAVREVRVLDNRFCEECRKGGGGRGGVRQKGQVALLQFQFYPRKVPPGTPEVYTACILCDPLLREHCRYRFSPETPASSACKGRGIEGRRGRGSVGAGAMEAAPFQPLPPPPLRSAVGEGAPGGAWRRRDENRPPILPLSPSSPMNGGGEKEGPWARKRARESDQGKGTRGMGGGGHAPSCHCGQAAKVLIVRKEGPNMGKEFYGCEIGQRAQGGCGFFQWADDVGGGGSEVPPPGRGAPDMGWNGTRTGNRDEGNGKNITGGGWKRSSTSSLAEGGWQSASRGGGRGAGRGRRGRGGASAGKKAKVSHEMDW